MTNFLKNARGVIIVSFFIVIGLGIAGFYIFHVKLDEAIHKTNYSFMQETVNQQIISFNAKLDGQFNQLLLYTRNFENIDMNDYTAVKQALKASRNFGDFKRISVANDIGVVINNDNTIMGNILKEDYYTNAMNGNMSISSMSVKDEADGEKVIILSVPVYQDEKVVGAVLGTFGKEALSRLFNENSFDGMGYTYVFTADGEIIMRSNTNNYLIENPNDIFDVIGGDSINAENEKNRFKEDLKNRKSGIIEFSKDKSSRIAVYKPVGMHNWYLLSGVDMEYISAQSKLITGYALAFIGAVVALMCVLIFIIYKTSRLNEKIMLRNDILRSNDERYKIANDIMKNIIFEYSLESNTLYATGNVGTFFNCETDYFNVELNEETKKELAERGLVFFDDMLEAAGENKAEFEKEYNLLCTDEKYRWVMLKATYIYDDNQKLEKIIGSLTDIQDQKREEEDLRRKAEIDLLTGLLNKKSVEKYIEEAILASSENHIFAVFVIDIDNFKGVNDNLGHIFGDEVLMEVGRKMKRVFRETDYVGRIGGDEFIAFLNYGVGTAEEAIPTIEARAEKLCDDFRETYTGKNADYKISASIGISIYPRDAKNYLSLFEKADKALYNSKKKGKDMYSVYEEGM